MFVIYANPRDFPGKFVVRRWLVGRMGGNRGTYGADEKPTAVVDTLEEARGAVPSGLIRLDRSAHDDHAVHEVWL